MSRHPIILAIEVSQRAGGVAIADSSGAVHSEPLRTADRRSDDLMPAISRLTNRLQMQPGDLDAVAVSVGPGGFTGLRIAVTTAKMLGEVLSVELVAVPSALVAAESIAGDGRLVIALSSKRDSCWATHVVRDSDHHWSIEGLPCIVTAETIDLSGARALVGDEHLPAAIRQHAASLDVPVIEPVFEASACLAVGARMLQRRETVDPLSILPIYPREPEAVTKWRARGDDG